MKKIYLLMAFLTVARLANAQTICDSCCAETFPYTFCSALDTSQYTACSANPNSDGNPVKTFIPNCVSVDDLGPDGIWQPTGPPAAPASLLSNDRLDNDENEEAGAASQFDTDQTLYNQIPAQAPVPPEEPDEPVNPCAPEEPYPDPVPLDRYTFFEDYVNTILNNADYFQPAWNYTYDDPIWEGDTAAYAVWCEQWYLDSATFVNGDVHETAPYDPSDLLQFGVILNAGGQDSYHLWDLYADSNSDYISEVAEDSTWASCDSTYEADSVAWPATYANYEGEALQYSSDSTAWQTNVNDYVQVFNQDSAQTDAQTALNNWLNLCSPPIQPCRYSPPCCLHVVMDDNSDHFFKTGKITDVTGTLAQTLTPGSGQVVPCKDSLCPSRVIEVNVTSLFLSAERLDDSGVSPSQYTLHSVSRTEFYTSQIVRPTTTTGYSSYSFFQLMEHEIGHYLGLNHPEDTADGHVCHNCFTANPFGPTNTSGFKTVMAQNNNVPNPGYNSPLMLTSEDACQFQKLYCNSCGGGSGIAPCAYVDGVTTPQPDEFNAELYPNPTTGACQLKFDIPNSSFVEIAVYNELGTQVLPVFSGYEMESEQSISLGTENLPSGNYVCRVRVGDRVSYINLEIRK